MSDTIIDGVEYGPLAALVGNWAGDKGVDRAPEPGEEERNPYYETINFEAIGDVTNADKQTLSVVRYHQVVSRKSNDEVFHNESGYYSYDPETGVICLGLTIPRGLALLAGGKASQVDEGLSIDLKATAGDEEFGVVQSPFMMQNAKTTAFTRTLIVDGDKMRYTQTTFLDIYGKTHDHIDINRLQKTA